MISAMSPTRQQPLPDVASGSDELRWLAVVRRDAAADGRFFYSVATTGVYCRPSCASRLARRENVAFYATAADAERAGFRPCKRCKPDQAPLAERQAELVARACAQIDASDSMPALEELARAAGMSRFHFHRVFKVLVGVTPKDYAARRRLDRVERGLISGHSVTATIYDAGYGSNSRFYEKANAALGMRPAAYRDGGRDTEIRFALGRCSLGRVLVAATALGVCAILLGDDEAALKNDLRARFPKASLTPGDADFERDIGEVIAHIEAPKTAFELPLDVRGTAFQQRVWRALREIPPGQTLSYAQLAERIGEPKATRAVAGACAANPAAVAIPCHRVVRADGALSGYRWGVERKRRLLEREAKP